jgi:hypothetical protein
LRPDGDDIDEDTRPGCTTRARRNTMGKAAGMTGVTR